ncbi:hypothetical protein AX16_009926 [Volvariella volvacea WC 439]|nr:hypothetical protein AX16_009926 [Volvariella volvacea WC 439]
MKLSSETLTWQSGSDVDLRGRFAREGIMANTRDSNFRPIHESWPVFALSVDLGNITTSDPVVWVLGIVREQIVTFTAESGTQQRYPLFLSEYRNPGEAALSFAREYPDALSRAIDLDTKILSEASAVSTQYANLVSMTARQAFAASEITISRDASGQFNRSDVKAFMKDLGVSSRVNHVDTLYAALPAFVYLIPDMIGRHIEPLLQYQAFWSSRRGYSAPDLGPVYPAALGNDIDTTSTAVDSTAGMLIMAYAHAIYTGDGTLIFKYYDLFVRWANYLVENALNPGRFSTSDAQFVENNTNLALKGIAAIRCMARISQALEQNDDAEKYGSIATNYVNQWLRLGVSANHLTSSYGDVNSWAMTYNLYIDQLLSLNLVGDSNYAQQANYYEMVLLSPAASRFGLPYDSNFPNVAKSHWTMFTAAVINDNSTRITMISYVHARASYNATRSPFVTTYDISSGEFASNTGGAASSAQGAMFALLALRTQQQEITVPDGVVPIRIDPSGSGGPSSTNGSGEISNGQLAAGVIAGVVVGAVCGTVLLAFAIWAIWRKKRRAKQACYPYANVVIDAQDNITGAGAVQDKSPDKADS